jgi:hypothetical protein
MFITGSIMMVWLLLYSVEKSAEVCLLSLLERRSVVRGVL